GYRKRPYEKIEQWMDNEIVPFRTKVSISQLSHSPRGIYRGLPGPHDICPSIYVDGGSSSKVMYEHCFRNLGPDTKAKLRESRIPLVGFLGEVKYPLGVIDLSVTMGEQDRI
ncbi:hypothetical protein Tco_0227119, partial [Tanacetum coccineum]